jgi:tRNA(Ile2) C34 agmatinyltransferase TiaS
MTATLTLDLFRPSILDPVGEGDQPQLRGPGFARDREPRRNPAPAVPVGGDLHAHEPMAQQGGGPTLDDLVVGVWEGLAAHRTVACPACGEAMTPRYSAGPAPVGGRCRSCGTTIS